MDQIFEKLKFVGERKCPASVAANVTLFAFDFIITAVNFAYAIHPAFISYFDIEKNQRCYQFVNSDNINTNQL